jgi:ATP-dependent helicase/nuclease subunit A
MARNWTGEQLTAINTTDRTLLLSAAAGSGKTATLTERLIRMITAKDRPLDVSRMLIVTFTRAAAGELRERISAAVSAAIEADPENRHLLRSSLLLPSAKIRTIDSFCNDLVKGHTEALGISPRYRIPDEAESALLSAELMNSLINDAYDGAFAPEGLDIVFLSECTVGARNEKDLIPLLSSLYDKLGGYPDGFALLEESLSALENAKAAPFFDTPWGREVMEATRDTFTDYKAALEKAYADAAADALFLSALGEAFTYAIAFSGEVLTALSEGYSRVRDTLASYAPPRAKAASDAKLSEAGLLAKSYRKVFHEAVGKHRLDLYTWEEGATVQAIEKTERLSRTVLLLLREFDRRYMEEKRRRGLCDYGDLEHFAYRLLWDGNGERTALAHELAASFDAVCIDEYQAVNDLQHRIFEAIATPTNRFMVGDIKQSIYGFRGAQPSIFASLRASLPPLAESRESAVLYLTQNFRSHGHLIDFNNTVFDFLFGVLGESIGYRPEDRLRVGRPAAAHPLPMPEISCLSHMRGEESTLTEWDIIADKIAALLENGVRADGERIRPSDIAVLLRGGKAKIAELAAVLSHRGIPVCTEDRQNFFLYPEILLALSLLNTVNNPRRDIYLAGCLRSPLYGFSMEELILIRKSASDEEPLFDTLLSYTEAHPSFEKGKRFLSELTFFRRAAEGLPSDRLLRLLFEKTGLLSSADAEGKKRLHVLYDTARRFEANAYHGLYRFISYLNELWDSRRSIGAARLLGEANGVSIITVHHSKGLEYPVCFLADADAAGGKDGRDSLVFHPHLGLGFELKDETGLALLDNPVRRAVRHAVLRNAYEEEARVLYVALTRASEQLYITAHSQSAPESILSHAAILSAFPSVTLLKDGSFLDWILAATAKDSTVRKALGYADAFPLSASELPPSAEEPAEKAPKPAFDQEEGAPDEAYSAEVARWREIYRERFSFVYPHEAEARLPGKISVSRLYPSYLDGEEAPLSSDEAEAPFLLASEPPEQNDEKETAKELEAPTVPFFLSGIEDNPAAKAGIATHLFLQFCRFEALLTTDGLQKTARDRVNEELKRLVNEGFIHPKDAERVRIDELVAFAESELLEEILAAKTVRREFRFNTVLPASLFSREAPEKYEGLTVFIQGVIDLLLETEDGSLILVDYKTDRLTRSMLKNGKEAHEMLFARHGEQLGYYALALEQIFGKRPRAVKVYSLHAGKSFPFAL